MRRKKVKLALGRKTVLQKIELGRKLVIDCTGNANFTTPHPALADITSACDAAETAYTNAQGGGVEQTAILHEKELALDIVLVAFASYVDNIAKGVETIILSSGFEASKDPEPSGEPAQVTGLEAKSTLNKGEIKLRWKRVPRVRASLVFISQDPDDDGSFRQVAVTTATRYVATGLESLKDFWFRVQAVGSGGRLGPLSDPANSVAL
jgi:hypothetical protein